ncbi:MAG: FAD-binding oxidoreductase [Chloroflexi bacterium]|nr:FAD-binding oxidoreductase [Chloroflexota bacterium]GIW10236.1 MAG: hypothetical protein KatS3mg061_1293 [Dehalococcoidia bacterium]
MNETIGDQVFDIAVLGSGPIGATSAYLLTHQTNRRIALIAQEPQEDHRATYRFSGGSIRLYWDDPRKAQAVAETAALIRQLHQDGVELDLLENGYVFVHRGRWAPSLNLSGAKLIRHLLACAVERGLTRVSGAEIEQLTTGGSGYRVLTSVGEVRARAVVLALGTENQRFLPELELEVEKRQLFVLDLPVDEHRARFPHLVVPLGEGVVFVFIKRFDGELRVVVGQEDVVAHQATAGPEEYFGDLLRLGLGAQLPFLREARVERVLWGFDVKHKLPQIVHPAPGLVAVNCGSALRSCAYIGREVVSTLVAAGYA